jgi:hypothetical protein
MKPFVSKQHIHWTVNPKDCILAQIDSVLGAFNEDESNSNISMQQIMPGFTSRCSQHILDWAL